MFDNKSIPQRVEGKPHIVFRAGWWRVSPLQQIHTKRHLNLWVSAHKRVSELNDRIRQKKLDEQSKRGILNASKTN